MNYEQQIHPSPDRHSRKYYSEEFFEDGELRPHPDRHSRREYSPRRSRRSTSRERDGYRSPRSRRSTSRERDGYRSPRSRRSSSRERYTEGSYHREGYVSPRRTLREQFAGGRLTPGEYEAVLRNTEIPLYEGEFRGRTLIAPYEGEVGAPVTYQSAYTQSQYAQPTYTGQSLRSTYNTRVVPTNVTQLPASPSQVVNYSQGYLGSNPGRYM